MKATEPNQTTETSRQLSRRGVLAGSVALAPMVAVATLPTLAGPALAATGDDAELIRLCAEFMVMQRRREKLIMPYLRTREDIPETVYVDRDAMSGLGMQMVDLDAATMAGLRAKAQVLLARTCYSNTGDFPADYNIDGLMGWSMARDLLGHDAARDLSERMKDGGDLRCAAQEDRLPPNAAPNATPSVALRTIWRSRGQ